MKLPCIAMILLGCFSVAAQASDVLPERTSIPVVMPQAITMQRQFPKVFDCAGLRAPYLRAGWPIGSSLSTLRRIDARLKRQIVLRPDQGMDAWTPLGSAILKGRQAVGDCDELSVTSLQMAICAGIPARQLGLLITESPNGGGADLHMVAYFRETRGRIWIFGDSFGPPRPLSSLREEVLYLSHLPDVRRWYTFATERHSISRNTSSTPRSP